MTGAGGGENGDDEHPRRPDSSGMPDPLGVEPGPETRALIAEFTVASTGTIVDRILGDRRVMLAVLRLGQEKREDIARELADRLPTLQEMSDELAKNPLILSLIAMTSEDLRKTMLALLHLKETDLPKPPEHRVQPPSPPEGSGGIDIRA